MGLGKSMTRKVSVYPASSSRKESVLSRDVDESGRQCVTRLDAVSHRQGFG